MTPNLARSDRSSGGIGTAVIVGAVTLYLALIGVGLALDDVASLAISAWTLYLLYAVVGGVILRQSARNPIGISVAVMGVVPLLGNLGEGIVVTDALGGFPGTLASWVRVWYFFVFLGAFVPLFHVFPTGKSLPGVWRWWYRGALSGSGVLVVGSMFGPSDDAHYINPFEVPFVTAIKPVLGAVMMALLVGGLVTGIVSLAVRFHRARERERQQLKWFFLSVVAAVIVFFLFPILGDGLGWIPVGFAEKLSMLGFPLPAVGILIAVTRYRLFDIDRVVSRTVSYAAVALMVAAVYAIPVVVLPDVLGLSSDLTVALATLAAAAVFAPLRRRVQTFVDRRFDRERYDAERVVAAFSGRLQTAVDLGRVTDELGGAVGAALRPVVISVWFAEPSGHREVAVQ
jgi:hypothetical protein